MKEIIIDIETIPSEAMPSLEDVKIDSRLKDEVKIAKARETGQLDQWKKEALISTKGRIFCVGYAIDDEDAKVITGSEEFIITTLYGILSDVRDHKLIGHNITSFDIPFLYHRAMKYKSGLRYLLPKDKRELFDTMEQFSPTLWGEKIGLKKVAGFFGLDVSGMSEGSEVFDDWQKGDEERIVKHCREDVELTRDVYKFMKL